MRPPIASLLLFLALILLAACAPQDIPQVVPLEKDTGQFSRPAPALRPTPMPVAARSFADTDAALAAIVAENGLAPFPGAEVREGDTPLAHLGRQLFFDRILSGDRNISCATCHHPRLAMADGRVLPIGTSGAGLGPLREFAAAVELGPEAREAPHEVVGTDPTSGATWIVNPFRNRFVPRNSPTIINSALLPRQFWDGRVDAYATAFVQTLDKEVNRLELNDPLTAQALFPVTSLHEMAGVTLSGRSRSEVRRILAGRLEAIPAYRDEFAALFGPTSSGVSVTPDRVAVAIAAFERQLIFTAAPWDSYLAGDADALSEQQKRGALLFFGAAKPAVNCAQCHAGDLFTDNEFHNLLVPQLGPGKGHGQSHYDDWGRSSFTFERQDRYKFRTPSLRNVALTAPYFHSGVAPTLESAIRHHAHIWNSAATFDPAANGIPQALHKSLHPFQPDEKWKTAAPELVDGLPLDEADIADLIAFLQALTDPAASDLDWLLLESVPSGLPVDTLDNEGLPDQTAIRGQGSTSAPASP